MQPVGPDGKRPRREPPVFYPTMADMRGSFEKYIESIEEDIEEFGIGRIVPPAGWTPRQEGYDNIDFTVDQPIKQVSAKPAPNDTPSCEKRRGSFFFPRLPTTDRRASPPPVSQHATGRKGLFRTLLVEQKPLSIKNDFKPAAMLKENLPSEAALKDTSVRSHEKNTTRSTKNHRTFSTRARPRSLPSYTSRPHTRRTTDP